MVSQNALQKEKQNGKNFFESGIYDDGFGALKQYLSDYVGCKVCFLQSCENYLSNKSFVEECGVQAFFLLSDDSATMRNFLEVSKVCGDCTLIVCMDISSINYAKMLNVRLKINCFYFFAYLPPVDAFFPYYLVFDGNQYLKKPCNAVKNYIVCYSGGVVQDKSVLIPCVSSLLCAFCSFLDIQINNHIFGTSLPANYKDNFIYFTKTLFYLFKQIHDMKEDFLDVMHALSLDFANFFNSQNISLQPYCFASIYQYLQSGKKSNFYESGMIASQIIVHLYQDFFNKYNVQNSFKFSVHKKKQMHAKFFNDCSYNVQLKSLQEYDIIIYLINRFKKKLGKKCSSFASIVDRLVNYALDLYADCGYSLYKNFDKQKTLQALYFTPDFTLDKTLLNVINDYGIFDNIDAK